MTNKSIPEISVDAKLLHQHLKTIPVGETVTYDTLKEIIGRDVRGSAYGAMTTARNRCLNDDHMVFEAVKNVGLKRMSDAELVNSGQSTIDRVRRAARKGVKKILCVQDFDKLPNDVKIRHNTYTSLLGAFQQMAMPSKVAKLETQVDAAKAELPLAKTLDFFRS